jgi:hypothetical protein
MEDYLRWLNDVVRSARGGPQPRADVTEKVVPSLGYRGMALGAGRQSGLEHVQHDVRQTSSSARPRPLRPPSALPRRCARDFELEGW